MCFLVVGACIFLVITSKLPEQELECFSLTGAHPLMSQERKSSCFTGEGIGEGEGADREE